MSAITLLNATTSIAQYVILKGEMVIARLPGIEPGGMMSVPTNESFQVTATAVINGNTYTSAPINVSGAMGFLAQVGQVSAQGTYEFKVLETASRSPNELQFQKTCQSAVTFTIVKDGKPLQPVVVTNSFEMKSLDISETFSIFAVVNGVTTDVSVTSNPKAIVTAVQDSTDLQWGYYTLDVA